MTDKLTLADCMKYPEAKIIKYDILNSGRTVIYDNIIRLIENYESGYHIIVHNCKLILREITDLADEEKQYILNNFTYDFFRGGTETNDFVWESFDEIIGICNNKIELINYLRSKNILVEPEDWFKQGKAVREWITVQEKHLTYIIIIAEGILLSILKIGGIVTDFGRL